MAYRKLLILFVLVVSYGTVYAEPVQEPLIDCISQVQQEWGEIGINEAAHAQGKTGRSLQIGEKHYDSGIGTHAKSWIAVDLWGEYALYEAEVGVQAHPDHDRGSVVFQVIVDDKKVFDSGIMRQLDSAKSIRINLENAQHMDLIVENGGDGITNDLANWANAVLTRTASPGTRQIENRVNVAPFARVITWDPSQTGSHPGRVEELSRAQIFLGEELFPDTEGVYTISAESGDKGCIGVQWYENRYFTEVSFRVSDDTDTTEFNSVQVQWWVGESEWQGDWKTLQGEMACEEGRWVFRISRKDSWDAKIGIQKIRWLFPPATTPVRVYDIEAYTNSHPETVELRIEQANATGKQQGNVAILNGDILEPCERDASFSLNWELSNPLRVKIRYLKTRTGFTKADRTVLCFQLPVGNFGVAVEDVIANKCVYVPDFETFVTLEPDGPDLEHCLQHIAEKKTVLQEVREMPDQSFVQAMEKVHRKVQNNGPTMLSLACDNHKFTVYENGGVQHRHDYEIGPGADRKQLVYAPKFPVQVHVTLNSEKLEKQKRSIEDGYMPIVNTSFKGTDVLLHQRAFVAPYGKGNAVSPGWLNSKPLFVAEFSLKNPTEENAPVAVELEFQTDKEMNIPASVHTVSRGAIACVNDLLLAFVDCANVPSLKTAIKDNRMVVKGTLPAGASESCLLYMPGWEASAQEWQAIDGGMSLDGSVKAYWHSILEDVMQVHIPNPLLQDVIYASQVHCLMTSRNNEEGALVVPWCGADRYGPLESESQAIIHGMSLMGHEAFSRRSLDYFISRYNEDGLLTTGYTLMGVGWHLWTLADHYAVYKNREWLQSVAPKLESACQWISRECKKTQQLNADGSKPLEYGLVAPGVAADWSRFAYLSRSEGEYYAGLMGVARSYADITYPGGQELLADAAAFRNAIKRSYELTQAKSPVVQLRNGAWIPYCPAMMGCYGRVMDIYPHEDGDRSWGKDMSMGAHNLVVLGVFGEDDRRSVSWITDYLEDFWCLQGGMGAYTSEETTNDWYNLGGFSKVQPYYTRLVEVYALMDDVKPFIRAYFNALPTLLNTENLNLWEHFGNRGAWNKPHETGWFLAQTRLMLVMERDQELWLAPFITNHWMQNGMSVGVEKAPTTFGEVSYTIKSYVNEGYIEAAIETPSRSIPAALVLRLRHPEGKAFKAVTVNGNPHQDYNCEKEYIRLENPSGRITVRAQY